MRLNSDLFLLVYWPGLLFTKCVALFLYHFPTAAEPRIELPPHSLQSQQPLPLVRIRVRAFQNSIGNDHIGTLARGGAFTLFNGDTIRFKERPRCQGLANRG